MKHNISIDWLVYRHWRRQPGPGDSVRIGPVEDLLSYNQNLPYREENVHPVADLFLAFRVVEFAGSGAFWIRAADSRNLFHVCLDPQQKKLRVFQNDRETNAQVLSNRHWAGTRFEVSLIDRQFLLAIDGQLAYGRSLDPSDEPLPGVAEPFALGVQNLQATLDSVKVFRDVYFTPSPNNAPSLGNLMPLGLGDHEFYVLGDNTAVSEDSRSKKVPQAVNRRLILGKPIIKNNGNSLLQ